MGEELIRVATAEVAGRVDAGRVDVVRVLVGRRELDEGLPQLLGHLRLTFLTL
jgi:hypothetical protein